MKRFQCRQSVAVIGSTTCGVLVLLLLHGWLLPDFDNSDIGIQNGIATLYLVEGDVKLKRSRGLQWKDAKKDISLEAGDKVRTGNGGLSAVRFDDTSEVKMKDNSLIVIERSKITLESGSASTKAGEGGGQLAIDTGSTVIRMRGLEVDLLRE